MYEIFFKYHFLITSWNYFISAGPSIKYDVISRLHPALLKKEILYFILRNRIIDEINRRHSNSPGKDLVKDEANQGKTDKGQSHLKWHQDRSKPYYAPTVSLKKYMLRKAGTKYGLRVQRKSDGIQRLHSRIPKAAQKLGLRLQRKSDVIQKLPLFVSVMKNRFYGVKQKRGKDKTLDLMEIYFKRMGRLEKANKKRKYRIICYLSCFIQRIH